MNERRKGHIHKGRLLALLLLVLSLGLSAGTAMAGMLTDTAAGVSTKAAPAAKPGTGIGSTNRPARPQGDSYMTLDPGVSSYGNYTGSDDPLTFCPTGPPCNPSSGADVSTGDIFVLDLNAHGASAN